MQNTTLSIALVGVVPPVCDAEAGEREHSTVKLRGMDSSGEQGSNTPPYDAESAHSGDPLVPHGFSIRDIRSAMAELCTAIRSALDDERATAEDSLRRAAQMLREMGESATATKMEVRGGLSPWQIRKVVQHIDAHLGRAIRNEELAGLARLNPSHFGRAFRNSFGEPPHEYVIRRRVERAQGLMLSTDASLSDIALDCGLADQAHLSRLFRRIVGETPRAWRRARIDPTAQFS
jgi:AraC-like DNA-binding protein